MDPSVLFASSTLEGFQQLKKPTIVESPAAIKFTQIVLLLSILLSRFAIPMGSSQMSVVGPLVLCVAWWFFYRGVLCFHPLRACLFVLLCGLVFLSASVTLIRPDLFGVGISWPSVGQFLILTSFFAFSFSEPVAEKQFYEAVNAILAFLAIAGLLQFAAQFAGMGLFSFSSFIPSKFSYEIGFNLQIPIGQSPYFKSNGFFLLEPSIFSQFIAMGLCIEILVLRRIRYVLLMLAALICSLSGTGWIILGSFVCALAFGLKRTGPKLAAATVGSLAIALVILDIAAPEFFDFFINRLNEFTFANTSGHARFIAPFWVVSDVTWRAPWAVFTGIGAGAAERLFIINYFAAVNTPIKLLIEFGCPVMIVYLILLVAGNRTRTQAILLVPGVVLLLVTGTYLEIPPVLFPIFMIIQISQVVPDAGYLEAPSHVVLETLPQSVRVS